MGVLVVRTVVSCLPPEVWRGAWYRLLAGPVNAVQAFCNTDYMPGSTLGPDHSSLMDRRPEAT